MSALDQHSTTMLTLERVGECRRVRSSYPPFPTLPSSGYKGGPLIAPMMRGQTYVASEYLPGGGFLNYSGCGWPKQGDARASRHTYKSPRSDGRMRRTITGLWVVGYREIRGTDTILAVLLDSSGIYPASGVK